MPPFCRCLLKAQHLWGYVDNSYIGIKIGEDDYIGFLTSILATEASQMPYSVEKPGFPLNISFFLLMNVLSFHRK